MLDSTVKKYLITGSSGFIGRHLIELCKSREIDFEVVRKNESEAGKFFQVTDFSTVIHLAGRAHILNETSKFPYNEFYEANCEYALDTARAAALKGAARFIYVSSIGVYGKSCSDDLISENSLLEPVEDYAKSKLEAERKLTALSKELSFELVIVRPALVYGFDAPGNIERLLKLTANLPFLPIAEKYNKRSFVYVENLVEFLLLVAQHPKAAGKIFNVADSAISTYELVNNFAKGMGRKPLLFSLPRFIWKIALRLLGKKKVYEQLFEDLVLDMASAEKELGWKSKHDTVASLQETGKRFIEANAAKKPLE